MQAASISAQADDALLKSMLSAFGSLFFFLSLRMCINLYIASNQQFDHIFSLPEDKVTAPSGMMETVEAASSLKVAETKKPETWNPAPSKSLSLKSNAPHAASRKFSFLDNVFLLQQLSLSAIIKNQI